jgi:hypothetical protein
MKKLIFILVGSLIMLTGTAISQEVVIDSFPLGVGGSVGKEFFKPYYPKLQTIADILHEHPLTHAVVTGGADGERYRENNDAKNPGLALGRAHALGNLLVEDFGVDSAQIIIRSEDVEIVGPEYRYASVRVAWELAELEARIDTLEQRPPIEKHFTEIREVAVIPPEKFGVQLGAGFSSSPFGGVPIVTGAAIWNRTVYVEALVGYTLWNTSYQFSAVDLDTRRRMAGADVVYFPIKDIPLGILGGWIRVEQISQQYYKYVRMSEGPLFGLRGVPFDFLSITAAYNPSKHRTAGIAESESDNDQFMIWFTLNTLFGGGK